MIYKRTGTIKDISEIPFDDEKIFTGSIGPAWLWRMKGMFLNQNGAIIFRDTLGCVMPVYRSDKIDLAILEQK